MRVYKQLLRNWRSVHLGYLIHVISAIYYIDNMDKKYCLKTEKKSIVAFLVFIYIFVDWLNWF